MKKQVTFKEIRLFYNILMTQYNKIIIMTTKFYWKCFLRILPPVKLFFKNENRYTSSNIKGNNSIETQNIEHSQISLNERKRENTEQENPANQKVLRDHETIFAKFWRKKIIIQKFYT